MFEDVLILKKGGIHIKKKNRGKFTEYCGGKVTEECIAKGKKSKNPKIRKRATFAANARKWKHKSGGILKAQEGTSELYPAGIAIPSNETIDFFKDFAQRYKKLNHINRDQLIQGLVAKDKAIVSNIGLPKYNTDTKQIFIPSDDMGVSTYPHELAHKLNDLVIKRTDKERKLLNDAYPLSIAKHVYGRAPEDMKNELIEDEKFSTNTELRRKISSDYGNVLGKKLNKVIKSLSTNDVVNYVNNINGYVGESDFLKYPEHIIDGKTLFEHWKEDIGDVPEYYNMPWEELPKFEQNQWQYLYDSREGVAPDYMIFDEDKPKAIKKALIKVAQESKSNDIRSKNFINVSRQGGILKAQNSAKLPGYVQYNGSDLSDIETFNKNWLKHRDSQLAHQGLKDENIKNKLNWLQRNFGASDKTVANLVREQLFSNLDKTKELSFSEALKDSRGRYLLTESMYADFPGERKLHEVEIGPPKPVEDWKLDYSFNGSVGGTHYPDFNTIIYNGLYQNTPVKIHERDHAMFGQYDDKNIGLKIVDNIFKHEFLDDDVVDKWGYYDEPGEIRARLMEMRYNNRLDPNHKYTFDEIENMRNDPTFIDNHIFNRYTNKYIEYLLNDVAQNTTDPNRIDYKDPATFAKNGGILKAQGGTGNLLTPHPLSPVGIALNQARAMAKGKKDQQHLPSGVKEVLGPDGKKVAIRTEQPLVPLEQSIAEWLPGIGDVTEVGYIANDVKNGNYGSAALATAMVALPGNVGKIFRKSDVPASKLTEAERLGIPKGERSNPKALDNPQYWGYEQWNKRYNAAVRAGNWEEVQRLRDLHFMSKAPDTKVIDEKGMPVHMYHGVENRNRKGKPYRFTKYHGVNWDLEELVESGDVRNHWRLSEPNYLRMTSYHTPSYRRAFGYGWHNPTLVHDDYLNITNPFTWDEEKIHQILLNAGRKSEKIPYKVPGRFKMQMVKDENGKIMRDKSGMPIYEKGEWIPEKSGFTYPQVSDWANFAGDSKEELMKLGYDGLYIPQYYNSYGAFISPSQFKSADPITWDGKGEIIPIVKRDNFRNLDTRYNKGGKL